MKWLSITFIFILTSAATYSQVQPIEKLAIDTLKITEEIEDVQVDQLEEDQETVTYWFNNSVLQQLIEEDSLLDEEPCDNKKTSSEENKSEDIKENKCVSFALTILNIHVLDLLVRMPLSLPLV